MKSDLRERLTTLHAELGKTSSVDPESRELLVALLDDITRVLQRSTRNQEEQESLAERLDELAVQFEAEHPALGASIRRVMDALAKAGI